MHTNLRIIIFGITIILLHLVINISLAEEEEKSITPQKDIIGSWQTSDQKTTLEFKPDGGFTYQKELQNGISKIKGDETIFTDDNHLIGIWAIPPTVYEVQVYKDRLILKDKRGKEIQLLRVK